MQLPFPIIISLIILLLASIGSAGNSKDKGKRKLDDTSFELQKSSSASQRTQHSGSPQPSHLANDPQEQQASPLRHESPPRREPRQFDLNFEPEDNLEINTNSNSSEKASTDFVRRSSEHIATMPPESEDEDEDIVTSIPLNQVPLPQMGLAEMPAASTAQMAFVTRNKNPKKGERDILKRKKQDEAIHSLDVELGVAAQNSSKAKWRTLEAYGQYILWLEKILQNNQGNIRNSLTAAKQIAHDPETVQIQIQIFELYIKNAEENAEYEKYGKKMFRVDHEEISKNVGKEFVKKIEGISDEAEIKLLKKFGSKDYPTIEYGKRILLLILPKLFMKKPQEIKLAFAIDWAKKYAKSLREQFLKYCAKELALALAHPPNFFENLPSTDQPAEGQHLIMSDMQPNKELELKEWDSFKEDLKTEMGIPNSKKTVGIRLILDAYRRDILWLEHLLLSNRHEILAILIWSGKQNLIATFNLLLKNAETNRAYEHTSEDIFKLTPEEIANDSEAKKIHDALEKVGKNKTNPESKKLYDVQTAMAQQALYAILPKLFMKKIPNKYIKIKTFAFEWVRQYRKSLREDYLAAFRFRNAWKPRPDFMPNILKR